MAEAGTDTVAPQGEQQGPQRAGGWQILKTLAFQMLFFYLITSYFRRGGKDTAGPDGQPIPPAINTFSFGERAVSGGHEALKPYLLICVVYSI